jgi:FkbM family methyltransferase
MSLMNEHYRSRITEIRNNLPPYVSAPGALLPPCVDSPGACYRFPFIYNEIDFNSIKTICDIGSRFLEQTIEMSYILPHVQFHSFEPVPGSYQTCVKNLNSLDSQYKDRIKVYELAMSNKTERIKFYEVDDTGSEHNVGASSKYQFIPGLNGSFFGKTWNQREIEVQAMTFDEWRQENNVGPIDLLWVDAQGSELDVFKGAEQSLKDVRVIMTEVGTGSYYQGQSLKPEIDEFLIKQGFTELSGAWEQAFAYEGNAIYIRK